MSSEFKKLAFTPNVLAIQEQNGSALQWKDTDNDFVEIPVQLGEFETSFIESQDHFYQATVAENGWPYVQYKGGPAGFLKVLDSQTIGYGDFRGNRQYISTGNLTGDNRVHLIFIDYTTRRRLKIWGHATIINQQENAELLKVLEIPTYRARVERGIVIKILAFDWNCPQHITKRYTEEEWALQA